jgi:glutamine cyclotransferase
MINSQIIQLTYKAEIGNVYDAATFRQLRTFNYPGEGWSLTNDGKQIYMDDGSAQIRIWDATTLQEKKRLTVRDGIHPVDQLNELEWVKGELYANIWHSDRIVRISPADGRVLGWIDLKGILPTFDREGAEVLNGIAYDSQGDRLFVTGKLWPKLFEIKVVSKTTAAKSASSGKADPQKASRDR